MSSLSIRITLIIFGFTVLFQPFGYAQKSRTIQASTDSTYFRQQSQIDSLRLQLRNLEDKQAREYVSTLEKTNQQLSLWFNPYAILIGSLAVLFALLAIVATAIIYRQSRDYKDKLDAFVSGYQEVFDKLIKEWKSRLDDIDKQIKNYQTELATATGEHKKTIEAEIERLRAQKDTVSSQIASTVTAMPASGSIFGLRAEYHHNCSKCGWGFMVKDPYQFLFSPAITGSGRSVKCPKCGNVDLLPQ